MSLKCNFKKNISIYYLCILTYIKCWHFLYTITFVFYLFFYLITLLKISFFSIKLAPNQLDSVHTYIYTNIILWYKLSNQSIPLNNKKNNFKIIALIYISINTYVHTYIKIKFNITSHGDGVKSFIFIYFLIVFYNVPLTNFICV